MLCHAATSTPSIIERSVTNSRESFVLRSLVTTTSPRLYLRITAMSFLRRLIPRSKVDVKDKFVLITGCDSGFGQETAVRLDKMGACVLATCLTKEGEQSLKSVASDRLKTFQMDVTSSQQIKEVYEEVERYIPYNTGKLALQTNVPV